MSRVKVLRTFTIVPPGQQEQLPGQYSLEDSLKPDTGPMRCSDPGVTISLFPKKFELRSPRMGLGQKLQAVDF